MRIICRLRFPELLPARAFALGLALGTFAMPCLAEPRPAAEHRHAIAMHGEPAMSLGFANFGYVEPAAPRGGSVVYAVNGTFDSLNPFVIRGTYPQQGLSGNVFQTLMTRSYDEPFTLYGALAETIATPPDRSFVEFRLNPRARFSDGRPVTAEDVVFTWELLRDHGRPNHRTYYSKVRSVEITAPLTVRFDLSGADDRELPLILGLMTVLPKHATDPETFENGGLTPLIGSGPYIFGAVEPGRSFTLERNPNYWGADVPALRGTAHFDTIRYDFYRDGNSMFEAFRRGLFDVMPESDPARWLTGYDGPALEKGRLVKDAFDRGSPKGMNGLAFNTRREIFADIRVREAIGILFNFPWINANLYHGVQVRTASFFEGSELSSVGRPAGWRERALLAPHPRAVRQDVMEGSWRPPEPDASGRDRDQLQSALDLLARAGWSLRDGRLRNAAGAPFAFEILVQTKDQERLALAFSRDLRRAGIEVGVRLVDAVQFTTRLQTYDFDMVQYQWDASLSPGNEQAFYWGSAAAKAPGTRNYMGADDPAIDAMIAAILAAREREELVAAVRALDRVLISGFYVVPLFHQPKQWIVRWAHIGRPEKTSLYGAIPETWWRIPPGGD